MKLEKWALIAEIVAALAVVASLVVLALEVHQNTQQSQLQTTALQNATYQDLVANVINLNSLIVQDATFAELLNRAETTPSDLSPTDVRRLNSYAISVFRHGDMAYFLYTQGTINQARLDSLLSIVVYAIDNSPLESRVWDQFKQTDILSKGYVAYVERLRKVSDYGSLRLRHQQ